MDAGWLCGLGISFESGDILMDRDLLYPGQIGLVENTLDAFKAAMISDGMVAEALLGESTQVFGLTPAALSNTAVAGSAFAISLGRGAIFFYGQTDSNAYGVLGTDSSSILKVGINLTATEIGITNASPPPAGYSINYLVSAQFQETDSNAINLPFYNAGGAPTVTVENGTRTQRVVFSVTGGTQAASGSQTTPSAPAGSVPLYVVTLTNGETAVASGGISTAPGAPFITNMPALLAKINTLTTNLNSEITTRTAQAGNLEAAVAIYSTTTLTQAQQGSFVEIAASSSLTTTLPAPAGQGGAFFRIYNSSANNQTLRTASGIFIGPGGNGTASATMLPGQMIEATSDNTSWVLSVIGAPSSYYQADQSGTITAAGSTTYTVAAVDVVFPSYSRSGAFRIRGQMRMGGSYSGSTSGGRQNFIPSVTDGTHTETGAVWLVYSQDTGDAWGVSNYYESGVTYAPGATETFTMTIVTLGGDPDLFTISGSFLEVFVVEA
jgi:hypothetical protein